MAEWLTMARPYAKAAFEASLASKSQESWDQVLVLLAKLVEDPQFELLITHPKVSKKALYDALVDAMGKHLSEDQARFIELLVQRSRLQLMPMIASIFATHWAEHSGTKRATLVSAKALSEADLTELAKSLEKKWGCKVDLNGKEDPSLMGGYVLNMGDQVIDVSIRGKLEALKNQIVL